MKNKNKYLYKGISGIINILRTIDTIEKNGRHRFLNYTYYYLPAENQKHSVIPTWVGASPKNFFKNKTACFSVNISIKKNYDVIPIFVYSMKLDKDKWNKAPVRSIIWRLSETLNKASLLWYITTKTQMIMI